MMMMMMMMMMMIIIICLAFAVEICKGFDTSSINSSRFVGLDVCAIAKHYFREFCLNSLLFVYTT
jgi:hypothetical protein